MKFDTVIIGGGLTGLIAGLTLQKRGQRTAIVSEGQSALHFWSGSFQYLRDRDATLPERHPYNLIGRKHTEELLAAVPALFAEAGLTLHGDIGRNHYHITPLGYFEPSWLTIDDYCRFDAPEGALDFKTAAVVNVKDYIDFYPRFIARGLEHRGVKCELREVDTPALDFVRQSCTEMRATNMARVFNASAIEELAREVERASADADVVFMPAIFGMFSAAPVDEFRALVGRPVWFVPTIPASVPGTRCQLCLRELYTQLGGEFLMGDNADSGEVKDGRLLKLFTRNLEQMPLVAEHYVFATGSFFGHGLIADIDRIYEPVLGLDLNITGGRTEWYAKDFYAPQPYMEVGVKTDDRLRPLLHGKPLENVYAAGAVLPGFNALKEGSGAGICISTALHAAESIIKA